MAFGHIHNRYVVGRRARVLAGHLSDFLPEGASVLDVGCGDGTVASMIVARRPDLNMRGIDVMVRPDAKTFVSAFDGRTIPAGDGSIDVVMFVDVLHHTEDPVVLLREALRVARRGIVIKDHNQDGIFSRPILRWMDRIGNARHGVALPYNYWPRRRWQETFGALGMRTRQVRTDLRLYPRTADWLFGRSLHFIAYVERSGNPAGDSGATGSGTAGPRGC